MAGVSVKKRRYLNQVFYHFMCQRKGFHPEISK